MRILGVDPGLAITGFAIIEEQNNLKIPVAYGCIRTSSKEDHYKRLLTIFEDITHIIEKYKPQVAAVEKLFFNKNVRTALKVGEARGVVLLAIAKASLDIYEYTPLQVKQALVGYGRADKQQVQYMVKSEFKLKKSPSPDDVADACAVALTHIRSVKYQNMIKEYK
ncbi:MAG: crossover junction endodeoxyribonuclease RuvC [Clostridia bacterium]